VKALLPTVESVISVSGMVGSVSHSINSASFTAAFSLEVKEHLLSE